MAKKENYCNGCKFKIETIGTNFEFTTITIVFFF